MKRINIVGASASHDRRSTLAPKTSRTSLSSVIPKVVAATGDE